MGLSEASFREDLKTAMRAADSLRVRVLRGLLAALKNRTIEARGESLSENDIVALVKREMKQTRETLEFARKGNRSETIEEQEQLLAVLEGYLPQQLGEQELRQVITGIVDSLADASIGVVMKALSAEHAGRFDGKTASRLVREAIAAKAD